MIFTRIKVQLKLIGKMHSLPNQSHSC